MAEWIQAHALIVGALLVLVLLVAWLVFGRRKPERIRREYKDVLSEGAGPAQRNTALIDTPPAAAIVPPAAAGLMAGVAEVVAHAAEEEVEQAATAPTDDLTRIKGLGPKLRTLLNSLGVTSFAQIAGWSEADVAAIDAKLGAFAGRPTRDNWVEQAKLLAAGDTAAYEEKFGKL
ncbi:hypothetical protein [Novosphingobium cyanobacteriorum]|uniref:Flap endonuclease-1-like 5' DNA nuclease n=1 Tax=Novosphingobium cyanobacteriorum TaxID=3024215 RepID=A0ABT6CJQ6_9SPHN|nr:hypothetical protein [Novosphingobium cyanobacteriorum]MDF8334153.1 hypothetical protein [Novosphingobium cyanobacteriorum]